MKVLGYLDNTIANSLLTGHLEDKKTRPVTDSLTGSILGQPLQSQILKIIGVPEAAFDPYVLRKFERGHHVEDWVMGLMPGKLTPAEIKQLAKLRPAIVGVDKAGQAQVLYKGVKGHIDGLVDMSAWDEPDLGIIPHEVKSVTNAAYKWIDKSNQAKWGHKLQIGFYAMALEVTTFMIHYIASDDYRIKSMLYNTTDIISDINAIIDEVNAQLATGVLPTFVSREDWQNNKEYQNYPMWSDLSLDEANEKLQEEFPEAYERLQSFVMKGGDK